MAYEPGGVAIAGRLALRWTVSPDGLTYTFTLRPGVTFHDGQKMTSADVKASFDRRRDPSFPLSRLLAGVADTTVPDPATFVVQLSRQQPWLLDVLAGAWGPKVMSASALTGHAGDDGARAWLMGHDAGTGPFRLAVQRDGGALLRRFDAYWGRAPHFATVEIAALPDGAAQVLRLRMGALDAVSDAYPVTALGRLPKGFTVAALPSMTLLMVYVNPLGVLADADLRRAVLTAVNPRFWLAATYGRHAAAATSLFSSLMFESLDPVDMPDDAAVARTAVQKIGAVSMTLGYPADQADALKATVDVLLAQLHAIGIGATAQAVPVPAVAGFARNPGLGPDLFLTRAMPDAAHPRAMVRRWFTANAPGNIFGVINPAVTRLARQAEAKTSDIAADKEYQRLSQRLFDTGGFVPLAEMQGIVVHRTGLTGLAGRPAFPPGAFDYAIVSEGP